MNEAEWILIALKVLSMFATWGGVMVLTNQPFVAACAMALVGFFAMYLEVLLKLVAP